MTDGQNMPTFEQIENSNKAAKKKRNLKKVRFTVYFFAVALLWQEIVTRLFTFGVMTFYQFLLITLFSVLYGLIFGIIISFIKNEKARFITAIVVMSVTAVVFCAQICYFSVFKNYFAWDYLDGAKGVFTDYIGETLLSIVKSMPAIIINFLPLVFWILFRKRFFAFKKMKRFIQIRAGLAAVASIILLLIFILPSEESRQTYHDRNVNDSSVLFGVMTSTRLGVKTMLFGEPKLEDLNGDETYNYKPPVPVSTSEGDVSGSDTGDIPGTDVGQGTETQEPVKPVEYGYNVLDIDFDTLIANEKNSEILKLHKFFSAQSPSKQHKYTGMFEGKNLIFMSLESFCGEFIDPELTPTLYKMTTTGFVFNNFYNFCWGGSTSTGEYANLTGLFQTSASCMKNLQGKYMPFALGNILAKQGYTTKAFHANSYDYYQRNVAYPTLGYPLGTSYLGKGNGFEKLVDRDGNGLTKKGSNKDLWPMSDLETAKVTIDQYINSQPFHVYYLTISGHCYYNWTGNDMCKRHRDEVQNLKYQSEEVKAYVAGELEVELMLTQLVDYLSEAGILENTVFVLSADHFPYELSTASMAELYNLSESGIVNNYNLYRNKLILWCAGMKETVTVNTPCSQPDILPTVLNIFGLEYDSRLMWGTDILASEEFLGEDGKDPIVVANCLYDSKRGLKGSSWGWITKYGQYRGSTFTAAEGYTWESDKAKSSYSKSITSMVNKYNYIKGVLTNDYYSSLRNYIEG